MATSRETAAETPPGFNLFLPPGFMTLPTGEPSVEQIQSLAAETSTAFGLDPDQQMDQGLAETTVMLLTMGAASAAGGSTYTAAGFFRSPDKTDRPIMALINCFYLETERQSVHTAIAGLEEIHRHSGACSTIVDLPAGRAVITHTRETNPLLLNDGSVDVVQHASTAWIPNLAGAGVASVAVTSNNTEDWSHVADMATGVFETFERGGD